MWHIHNVFGFCRWHIFGLLWSQITVLVGFFCGSQKQPLCLWRMINSPWLRPFLWPSQNASLSLVSNVAPTIPIPLQLPGLKILVHVLKSCWRLTALAYFPRNLAYIRAFTLVDSAGGSFAVGIAVFMKRSSFQSWPRCSVNERSWSLEIKYQSVCFQ